MEVAEQTPAQQPANPLERSLTLNIPAADIEKDAEKRLKRIAPTVKMPGFRPGKVPMRLVKQMYGSEMWTEAVSEAIERTFNEAVAREGLRVAGSFRIEPAESADAAMLAFTARFEVYPEVEPADLSGQTLERPQLEITEAEVDKTLERLRKQRATWRAVDRPAQEGDRVTVSYTARKDGEVVENGQVENFPFVIGAGALLGAIENAPIGMRAGETKTFEVAFPEGEDSKFAGQTLQFELTVHQVEEPELPAVDADFARALGIEDGDVQKLRDEIRASLERELKQRRDSEVKQQVFDLLLSAHDFAVPSALVQTEAEQLVERMRRDLRMRGFDAGKLDLSPQLFEEEARRRVKLGLIIGEIVKRHELQAKPEQVRALVEEAAAEYEHPEAMVNWYYADPQRLVSVEAVAIENNVVQWVLEQVQVVDKPVEFDEFMTQRSA
ncbi:MAG: trigger factor [Rhodocyclales bacterium]|nr:trigger factor [Rhodocyclales bacterium]